MLEETNKSTSSISKSHIPWPGVEIYFSFLKEEGDNIIVTCHSCPSMSLSTSKSSPSNLKRHIKRLHYYKYDEFVGVCNSKLQLKRSGSTSGDNTSEIGVKKQITLDTLGSRKDLLHLNKLLISIFYNLLLKKCNQ
eukprot:XP_016662591.1 PREDICTED: uncharacterized protein LOC107884614 [Acyrthosiphon pisum]